MSTTPMHRLADDDLVKLLELVQGSDSIELKATVPDANHRATIAALGVDPLNAQIRQVFFFDTPDLALNRAGVVVRARRIQGRDHDSVVKLRPVVPSELPAGLRSSPNLGVEVDVIPGAYVCSAAFKRTLGPDVIAEAVHGNRPLRKLFSKEQRAFFTAHAPEGIGIDDLSILGPIFVLKVKLQPKTFSRRVVVEMWLYPDGSRILELSTKCRAGRGHPGGPSRSGSSSTARASCSARSSRRRPRRRSSSTRRSCEPRRRDRGSACTSRSGSGTARWRPSKSASSSGPRPRRRSGGVAAGTERQHPRKGKVEVVERGRALARRRR